MSKQHSLHVLYGLAGDHMGDNEDIERYFENNPPIDGATFHFVRPSRLAQILNWPNTKGFLPYTFYLAYKSWHSSAFTTAQYILEQEEIDAIHYLCPIGFREPGFLWKLGTPYVWGPVGGVADRLSLEGQARPIIARAQTLLKNTISRFQLQFSPRVRKAILRADAVISSTPETQLTLAKRFGVKSQVIPENAILDTNIAFSEPHKKPNDIPRYQLVWIGSLDYRKAPDLLLDIISNLRNDNWDLHIVGDGTLLERCKSLAAAYGINDKVAFHGRIPRDKVISLLKSSDLHLITSLAEGNPTTIWEAMSVGVPTISLKHAGMENTICGSCGDLIEPISYRYVVNSFSETIDRYLQNPDAIEAKKSGALRCGKLNTWHRRALEFTETLENAVALHNRGKE